MANLDRRKALLIVGVVLAVVGIILLLITEPAGTAGSGASGGIADESEDTRPYLWYGIGLLVVGAVVAVVGYRQPAKG